MEPIKFIKIFTDDFKNENLRNKFRNGYCWHFAHLLKNTFQRGEVCLTYPYGHFVWVDLDKVPYDIEGIYAGEAEEFIPEKYLNKHLENFIHRGISIETTKMDIDLIYKKYKKQLHSE